MDKKADMGIGTLILFIAMILVAAIAAGVLIQTATSLQNKALLTGDRSKSQVSTNIMPIILHAEDGSDSDGVDEFHLKAKLAPGSDAINIEDLLVEFSLSNLSMELTYDVEGNCTTLSTTKFHVDHLIPAENHIEGYLQSGDVISLCFQTTRKVKEDESVFLRLIPKVGSPTLIESAMPDIMTEKRIVVYP